MENPEEATAFHSRSLDYHPSPSYRTTQYCDDETHSSNPGRVTDAISIAIAIIGTFWLGGLGAAMGHAALRLSVATAYYGVASASAAAAGYGTVQVARHVAKQSRPGIIATIRAAHGAAREITDLAIAIDRAALQAALAAQNRVVLGAEAALNASRDIQNQVVDRTSAAVHGVSNVVGSLGHQANAQEAVPVKMLSVEEAHARIADNIDDGIEYFLEEEVDEGTIVWRRIRGGEDLGDLMFIIEPSTDDGITGERRADNSSSKNQGEQPRSGEQCSLDQDEYVVLEDEADDFDMVSDAP